MTVLRDSVVKNLTDEPLYGSPMGDIRVFDQFLGRAPVSFWNQTIERLIARTPEGQRDKLIEAIYKAAHDYCYEAGHHILESETFKQTIEPMITQGTLDLLRGLLSVFTSWGWAKSGIIQHVENKKLVVRAVDYYEADGAIGNQLRAFLLRGAMAACFDLVYGGPYPQGSGKFRCEQTHGIECGAKFGEFIVTAREKT